jgi:Smg protein
MGPHERGRFTSEAWGLLLALKGSGAISASELEHVIERAMNQIDGRIALDDLRAVLDGSGVDDTGSAPGDGPVH